MTYPQKLRSTTAMKLSATLTALGIAFLFMILTFISSSRIYAHGYIESPTSRAVLCQKGTNTNCGAIRYEPQSLEALKGFPQAGPADGQIASAGKFTELDVQTKDRWKKVDMTGGKHTFKWHLTANHLTTKWEYFITKKDWNPNEPLTRASFESTPFHTVNYGGAKPPVDVVHEFNVPTDRSGYHVILGVWEIADTNNSFYQVIDVNLSNGDTQVQPPTVPGKVTSRAQTTTSIVLNWDASTASNGIKQYEVYRNGQLVGTTLNTTYTDTGLTAATAYTYTVKAVDTQGNRSAASSELMVSTKNSATTDSKAPAMPTDLRAHHVMETSIHLTWTTSADNENVVKYEVYRNGKWVGTATEPSYMDSGLTASTSYTYTVKAVDVDGNPSAPSAALQVKTATRDTSNESSNDESSTHESSSDGTSSDGSWSDVSPSDESPWDSTKIYTKGDRVSYNGVMYEAKWWTKENSPEQSEAWKLISDKPVAWNKDKAYHENELVIYNGQTYKAKWWIRGEVPDQSSVWELVK